MEIFYSFILLLWVDKVLTKGVLNQLDSTLSTCNETCLPEKCPKPEYCKGELVKDSCGCCSVCSTDNSTHLYNNYKRKKGGACEQVSCPRKRVCMENMQGLPLCTCPNLLICRRRRKPICGSDGNTYNSRCHMRVTSCNMKKRIKVKHKGVCQTRLTMNSMVATQQYGGSVTYPEGEFDIRRRRRKNRRKERRKHNKKEKRRRKRRFKNKKNDKKSKRRKLRRLRLRNKQKQQKRVKKDKNKEE